MRISDWSSDVCSSDLEELLRLFLRNFPEADRIRNEIPPYSAGGHAGIIHQDIDVPEAVDGRGDQPPDVGRDAKIRDQDNCLTTILPKFTGNALQVRSEENTSELQ